MPDPKKKTVSASQMAGLFNVSPYVTRWMLYHHFKNGVPLDVDSNSRMDWGLRLQAAILLAAAELLRLEVINNDKDEYRRHRILPIGATEDGSCFDPSRGMGIVEAKNVDWLVWKNDWTETAAPKHIEIQLQTQMMVNDATWGVIACLVGGNDLILYEREPMPEVWEQIKLESIDFFDQIAEGVEPDAIGKEIEMPVINALYPEVEETEVANLFDDPEFAEDVFQWNITKGNASAAVKALKELQALILAKTKDAGHVVFQEGELYIKKSVIEDSYLQLDKNVELAIKKEDPDFAGVITRRGHVRTTIKLKEIDPGQELSPEYTEAFSEYTKTTS